MVGVEMDKGKTYKGIDCFKLFAAIGIVAIHTNLPFFETLGRLGLPFFSIVTSFFFFKHYLKLNSHKEKIYYLKKFEFRLLWLYFLWQILYIPLAIKNSARFFEFNGISVTSFLTYIFDLIFKLWPSGVNGWFPSWYIIGIIIAVPFSLFVYKYIFRKNNYLYGLFCIVVEMYFVLCSGLGILNLIKVQVITPDSFPRFLIYIFLGYLIASHIENVKKYRFHRVLILACILVVLFYLENLVISLLGGSISNDETILTVPTSLVIVILAILYTPSLRQTTSLRKFSTFLYCFQAWGFAVFDHFNYSLKLQNTTAAITDFIFVMSTALIAFVIYNFIRNKTQWKIWNYMV